MESDDGEVSAVQESSSALTRLEEVRLLRLPEVERLTGISKATIWRLEKMKLFPPKKQISAAAIGYTAESIYAWIKSLPNADISREIETSEAEVSKKRSK